MSNPKCRPPQSAGDAAHKLYVAKANESSIMLHCTGGLAFFSQNITVQIAGGWTDECDLTDVDVCSSHQPCRHGSTCHNDGRGGYTCTCLAGFAGTNCERDVRDCRHRQLACLHNGTCQVHVHVRLQRRPTTFAASVYIGSKDPYCNHFGRPRKGFSAITLPNLNRFGQISEYKNG